MAKDHSQKYMMKWQYQIIFNKVDMQLLLI